MPKEKHKWHNLTLQRGSNGNGVYEKLPLVGQIPIRPSLKRAEDRLGLLGMHSELNYFGADIRTVQTDICGAPTTAQTPSAENTLL